MGVFLLGLALVIAALILSLSISNPSTAVHEQQSSSDVPVPPPNPKEELARAQRNGARTLENTLVGGGYDVHVGFLGKERGDNNSLLIYGSTVDRVFVHQLLGPGLKKSLV